MQNSSSLLCAPGRCPHLELVATAATSSATCSMTVNGVDLFSDVTGCGLDKLVVGRDGVCAALIDPPYAPRAACFDTKTQVPTSTEDWTV